MFCVHVRMVFVYVCGAVVCVCVRARLWCVFMCVVCMVCVLVLARNCLLFSRAHLWCLYVCVDVSVCVNQCDINTHAFKMVLVHLSGKIRPDQPFLAFFNPNRSVNPSHLSHLGLAK
jgi:hypothetical protein